MIYNNIDIGYIWGLGLDYLFINGILNILEILRWLMIFSNEWKGWWFK